MGTEGSEQVECIDYFYKKFEDRREHVEHY